MGVGGGGLDGCKGGWMGVGGRGGLDGCKGGWMGVREAGWVLGGGVL